MTHLPRIFAAGLTALLATGLLACSSLGGSSTASSSSGSRSGSGQAQMNEHEVTIEKLPATMDEFLALRDAHGSDPFGAASLFVVAQIVYTKDETLGHQMFTVLLDKEYLDNVGEEKGFYKGYRPRQIYVQNWRDRLGKKPWIARSYITGTAKANDYALPAGPFKIRIREQSDSLQGDTAKVFVWSEGADSPRPLHMKKDANGNWKATNWGSLEVDVDKLRTNGNEDL